ncbi:Aspartokinase associated with ectoine biosynthesis [Nitrincola lacisaponensis]|uniref:aspartate kinase n=1 Tax=Nitrincola lacisaponensis TaxID=267850 RepID=A0A063XYH2_9GAMM|nr:aspartate kinase [Nitrincola lacisaponensis]KDE39208.1 Aspartokinase associated with ectoine biosynthesis [Nitrincola lacisaponensis]
MHTVEKIGGTSMSRFSELMDTILMGNRKGAALYNRIFVVSAYGGMTNLLLEHKKTGEPGVYARFAEAENETAWQSSLDQVRTEMLAKNAELFSGDDRIKADRFILERIDEAASCMANLQKLCSVGHFQLQDHLLRVREMLASLGETHSAFNSVLALQNAGVNARFVDLSGWHQEQPLSFDEMIQTHFQDIDLTRELPIATGYAHCQEGVMRTFDRGYSEMTFSKIATLTGAHEAIIHKEYHLSSADPAVVGLDKIVTIGRTNYDVADQLSNLGMEAIHPKAAKGLRQQGIKLRIKNAFEPHHAGTVISNDYCSASPCVEIIAGRRNVFALEIFDQDMLGDSNYDIELARLLHQLKLYIVNRDSDANSITYYVAGTRKMVNRAVRLINDVYPGADVDLKKVAIVSAIGSDLKVSGILARTVSALASANISIQALHQSMRQVEMQCVVNEEDYESAVKALHHALIEQEDHGDVICAA